MNIAFDERYDIRLANLSDVGSIMQYIGEHWRKGHILSVDRELFNYEFVNGDDVNFIIAVDKLSGELEAVYGFINCSNPRNKLNSMRKDLWGSFWSVSTSRQNMPLLGVELARRIYHLTGCRMLIGNGTNPKTSVPLMKLYMRDKTVRLKHYYYLNPDATQFKIAVISELPVTTKVNNTSTFVSVLDSIAAVKRVFDIDEADALPYKDSWYFEKRYFRHPYYSYGVYGVYRVVDKILALLVARVVEVNGNRVFRIVDYIGDHSLFAGLGYEIEKLLCEYECEYADLVVHGIDEGLILSSGFVLRTENDVNIIPNYFEPFEQKNVDIWAHYKFNGTTFFKADGDQDRPNIIRERI